jgi:hypothetical protein
MRDSRLGSVVGGRRLKPIATEAARKKIPPAKQIRRRRNSQTFAAKVSKLDGGAERRE